VLITEAWNRLGEPGQSQPRSGFRSSNIWPEQSQSSISINIYVNDDGDRNPLTLATGLQTLQLMKKSEKTFLQLRLKAEEALRVVAVTQSQLPTEGGEDGHW
jgi:hypothetical protein